MDHFALLHVNDQDHPVDTLIDGLPDIAARARRLRRLADQVQQRCQDNPLFLNFYDLRLLQQTECEKLYFNVGFEHGRLAGRAASLTASTRSSPAARILSDKLQVLLATSTVPDNTVALAIILEFARALAMSLVPDRRPPKPQPRRAP